jgi:hypothetical protein
MSSISTRLLEQALQPTFIINTSYGHGMIDYSGFMPTAPFPATFERS